MTWPWAVIVCALSVCWTAWIITTAWLNHRVKIAEIMSTAVVAQGMNVELPPEGEEER